MKFARFTSAALSGALALITMSFARAEVVTIAPDGNVERSEDVASSQSQTQYAPQHNRYEYAQETPRYNLGTPEQAARYAREHPRQNNNHNHHDGGNRHRNDYDRQDWRSKLGRHLYSGGYYGSGDYYGTDITIIGNNTDVYIGGQPDYGYGNGYPTGGYPYNYGNSYGYGGYNDYYGGTYGNGGPNVSRNRQTTVIAGQPGMQPAWPNMQPATGMGAPDFNQQPRLPNAIYNPGRRR